jgi:hypothetical protein
LDGATVPSRFFKENTMRKLQWLTCLGVVALVVLRLPTSSPAVPVLPSDPWPGEYTLINPAPGGGFGGFGGLGGGQLGQFGGLGGQFGLAGGGGFNGFAPTTSVSITKDGTGYALKLGLQASHFTPGKPGVLVRDDAKENVYLGTLRFPSGIEPEKPVLLWAGRYYLGTPRQIRW